jgi:hypothetical protein
MADTAVPNGTHTPETPKPAHASLALTEYSANPSPPSATPRDKTRDAGVPPDFLLPTGYPDVSVFGMNHIEHISVNHLHGHIRYLYSKYDIHGSLQPENHSYNQPFRPLESHNILVVHCLYTHVKDN